MKSVMKLLAALLTLCLMMSGVAAMATVEANLDADGKLAITESDVTNTSEDIAGVHAVIQDDPPKNTVYVNGESITPADVESANAVEIKVDSIDVDEAGADGIKVENRSDKTVDVVVEGDVESGKQCGIETEGDGKVNIEVQGDVTSGVKEYLHYDGVFAHGESAITIGGNVNGACDGVDAGDKSEVRVDGNVIGAKTFGVLSQGESSVTVGGDVTGHSDGVSAEDSAVVEIGGNVEGCDSGIKAKENAEVKVGGSVTGTDDRGVVAEDKAQVEVAGGVTSQFHGVDTSNESVVTVAESVRSTGGNGVVANGSCIVKVGQNVEADHWGISVWDKAVAEVGGSVTGDMGGVYASGESTVSVHVNVTSDNADGVSACDTSSVTVGGNVKGDNNGVDVSDASIVTIGGDVKSGHNGVYASESCIVTAGGSVTSDKVGIHVEDKASVEVFGDVKGGTAGIELDDAEGGGITVTIGGTLSGDDGAVKAIDDKVSDQNTEINVWKIAGEIATSDSQRTADQLASVIHYLIKLAADSNLSYEGIAASGTAKVGDEEYKTALEGEEVTLTLKDGEVLKSLDYGGGVMLTKGKTLTQDTFVQVGNTVKLLMARGGAMLLAAKMGEPEPAPAPAPAPAPKPKTEPKHTQKGSGKHYVFVYVPVEDETEVYGVRAADHAGMAGVLKVVGGSLEGEDIIAEIIDQEKLIPVGQLAAFKALPLSDRMGIVMRLLGCGETDALGEAGTAVLSEVDAEVEAMSESAFAARRAEIDIRFQPRLVIVDGMEYDSVGIELKITRGSSTEYWRYTFIDDAEEWKLHLIEKGIWKEA